MALFPKTTARIATELALPAPYVGQVATRCYQPTDYIGTVGRYQNSRTMHRMRSTVTSLKVAFPGYHVAKTANTETETPCTGVITIDAAIEYPIGTTATSFTFTSQVTGTLVNGGLLWTDELPINIPEGALFAIRTFIRGTIGVPYMSGWVATAGDSSESSATAITNRANGTGVMPTSPSAALYVPAAIVSRTSRPSLAFIGDSKSIGQQDSLDGNTDIGELARSIGPIHAYMNLARSGGTMQGFILSHANRIALALYASHIIFNYGVNDAAGSRTSAQMQADLTTIVGYLPGKPIYGCTITPYTTGAWAAADGADQTVVSAGFETNRVGFNTALRNSAIPTASALLRGVIDLAQAVEIGFNSGKWVAGLTGDGIHENTIGSLRIQQSNVVNPAQFRL